MKIIPSSLQLSLKKIIKALKIPSIVLTAMTAVIGFNLAFTTPAISENAVKQNLSAKQLGKIISKTERSWEYDYEDYFKKDFTNYSQSEKEIAQQLTRLSKDTGTNPAVMWAVPTPQQLYLLLITPGSNPIIKSVSVRGKTLAKIVDNFNRSIVNSRKINSKSYLPSARLLHKWIIEPIEPELKAANIDTLMLCSGSGLRTFPFAALNDGEKFLIEKYSLVRLPALNLTNINFVSEEDKMNVLAMGASEFADLPALPGVEVEVSTVTPQSLPGTALLNQDFTVKNLQTQHQENNFDLIHLATHAEFNPGSADNSYIQFSDRKVGLDEVDELGLSNPPVDLLVLSACKTAVGNKDAEFGFAGLALQTGVKSVLASLWSIDDAGTVALMSEFYQNLKADSMKAQALQESQIAMLQGKVYVSENQLRNSRGTIDLPETLAKAQSNDLSHPFYWAGFSIMGNPW